MHLRLRELASPPDTPYYPPIEISEATLVTSVRCFPDYFKTHFVRSYFNMCNINPLREYDVLSASKVKKKCTQLSKVARNFVF